jgi:hypothetical protein
VGENFVGKKKRKKEKAFVAGERDVGRWVGR